MDYQLSDVEENDEGNLLSAELHFRTDLKKEESKSFTFSYDVNYEHNSPQNITLTPKDEHIAVLAANKQQIEVPYGAWEPNTEFNMLPAPIIKIGHNGNLFGHGSLLGGLVCTRIEAEPIETGSLFYIYRVRYEFGGGKSYTVDLTVRHNEQYITVDEYAEGLTSSDGLAFKLSYKDGVNPAYRMMMANGGEQMYDYDYDKQDAATGLLKINVGIEDYATQAWTFWRPAEDGGENAILFVPYRTADWEYTSYSAWTFPQNETLRFYASDADSYMQTALYAPERHWAVSVIPSSDVVINGLNNGRTYIPRVTDNSGTSFTGVDSEGEAFNRRWGGDPAIRLWEKLTDFSLNFYKDIDFDFDEDLGHTLELPGYTGTEYTDQAQYRRSGFQLESRFQQIADFYWNMQGDLSGINFGVAKTGEIIDYLASRKNFSEKNRKQIRSWFIWLAEALQNGQNAVSARYSAVMGGQPNFFAPWMTNLAVIAAAFPEHPKAASWVNTAQTQMHRWFDLYVRKDNDKYNTVGGRFTENPICYNYASMEHLYKMNAALMEYNGTNIFDDNPAALDWAQWNLDILVPNMEYADGFRIPPPEGAHAAPNLFIENGIYNDCMVYIGDQLKKSSSERAQLLGENFEWVTTGGESGTKPVLESKLYTDYGPVFHYGEAGSEDEAYLHMTQIGPRMNYRWGNESILNGSIFYSADGYSWSWNGQEDNGDQASAEGVTNFRAGDRGILANESTNVLYDLDFAQQYYAAAGSSSTMNGRGVMMIRGDYIAVLDDVKDNNNTTGVFNWVNRTNRLCTIEHFENADFTNPTHTIVGCRAKGDGRFPIQYNMNGIADNNDFALNAHIDDYNSFSVRFSGEWIPIADSITFTRYLGENDESALLINGVEYPFDENDQSTVKFANTSDPVEFEYRYQHNPNELTDGGMIRCSLRANTGTSNDWFNGTTFQNRMRLPDIYPALDTDAGAGDQMHIVSPKEKISAAELTEWGAKVRLKGSGKDEYVFYQSGDTQETDFSDGTASFAGIWGYAAENQIAVFKGTKVSYGDLMIEKDGNDFGVSAEYKDNAVIGRFVGTTGGDVTITLPSGFSEGSVLTVDGKTVSATYENGRITFSVSVSQSDGVKHYSIIK